MGGEAANDMLEALSFVGCCLAESIKAMYRRRCLGVRDWKNSWAAGCFLRLRRCRLEVSRRARACRRFCRLAGGRGRVFEAAGGFEAGVALAVDSGPAGVGLAGRELAGVAVVVEAPDQAIDPAVAEGFIDGVFVGDGGLAGVDFCGRRARFRRRWRGFWRARSAIWRRRGRRGSLSTA